MRTLSAVADVKEINLGQSRVNVQLELTDEKPEQSVILIALDLEKIMDHRQRSILVNSARSCEVAGLISGKTTVELQVT